MLSSIQVSKPAVDGGPVVAQQASPRTGVRPVARPATPPSPPPAKALFGHPNGRITAPRDYASGYTSAKADGDQLAPEPGVSGVSYKASKHLLCDGLVEPISAVAMAQRIDEHYSSPLPDVDDVFPWLHGLHPRNLNQRAFLDPLRRFRDRPVVSVPGADLSSSVASTAASVSTLTPDDPAFAMPTAVRGLLVLKVGDHAGALGTLVGSVFPHEILVAGIDIDDDFDFAEYERSFRARRRRSLDARSGLGDRMDVDEHSQDHGHGHSHSHSHWHAHTHLHHEHQHYYEETPFLPEFLVLDPPDGISLRNFHIQVAKWATISDIYVYAPDPADKAYARSVARMVALAQRRFREEHPEARVAPEYRTYLCEEPLEALYAAAPHVVSVPPRDQIYDEDELRLKNWDSNLLFHERVEMSMMSSATPVTSDTVWLGNIVDFETFVDTYHPGSASPSPESPGSQSASQSASQSTSHSGSARPSAAHHADDQNWATFVECFEGAQLPPLNVVDQYIREAQALLDGTADHELTPISIQFPSSGSVSLSACHERDFFAVVSLCKLIYLRSRVTYRGRPAGVLIYCSDGYTETSLLALAYVMYATGVPASQAWIDLHVKFDRIFFCFTMDVVVLLALEGMLLAYSPAIKGSRYNESSGAEFSEGQAALLAGGGPSSSDSSPWKACEPWFAKLDGSLPSRILPHMYLGSLVHADNPEMLARLGIRRVLSVGETLSWVDYADGRRVYDDPHEGITKLMYMDNIQDDGVDALSQSLAECLDFLDEGYRLGEPTLVHCRVGVSRSATVCIAEVMKRLGVGLPRAYLFVRVRRLNVIIQPNLRFMFELVKWEESHRRSGEGWLREVDWHILCREITAMNKVYIS